MKSVLLTPEFWITTITNLIGMAVMLGSMTSDQGQELSKAVTTLSGAIVSIASVLGAVFAQAKRKEITQNVLVAQMHTQAQLAIKDPILTTASTSTVKPLHVQAAEFIGQV